MVGLHVDEFVHDAARREEGAWIEESLFLFSVAGEVGEWVVFVLSKFVPCCDDPGDLLFSVPKLLVHSAKDLPCHSDDRQEDLH